ncbi:MAG: PilZ domain-containing protein [Thiogranum sp.]|nr:PilZ domain-containing protein [Thiogranum sp.]
MTTSERTNRADMRKSPRLDAPEQVAVRDLHSGEVVGQLVNLSVDGLMLLGAASLEPGTLCQFRVPIDKEAQTTELVIGAEVLWCQDANHSGSYWSGFHIIDISPEHLAVLTAMVGD